MSNIIKALESLHDNGGFTYSFVTGELNPATGFSVAINKELGKTVSLEYLNRNDINLAAQLYALDNIAYIVQTDRFFGAWIEDGNLHLDVVEVVLSDERAHRLCIKRDQLAYYDNANKKTIFINPKTD